MRVANNKMFDFVVIIGASVHYNSLIHHFDFILKALHVWRIISKRSPKCGVIETIVSFIWIFQVTGKFEQTLDQSEDVLATDPPFS